MVAKLILYGYETDSQARATSCLVTPAKPAQKSRHYIHNRTCAKPKTKYRTMQYEPQHAIGRLGVIQSPGFPEFPKLALCGMCKTRRARKAA